MVRKARERFAQKSIPETAASKIAHKFCFKKRRRVSVPSIPDIDGSRVAEPMPTSGSRTGYRKLCERDGPIAPSALIQYGLNSASADVVRPFEIGADNAANSDYTPKP
jgi:hypothetical protein